VPVRELGEWVEVGEMAELRLAFAEVRSALLFSYLVVMIGLRAFKVATCCEL